VADPAMGAAEAQAAVNGTSRAASIAGCRRVPVPLGIPTATAGHARSGHLQALGPTRAAGAWAQTWACSRLRSRVGLLSGVRLRAPERHRHAAAASRVTGAWFGAINLLRGRGSGRPRPKSLGRQPIRDPTRERRWGRARV
jgi:hypothetical protein